METHNLFQIISALSLIIAFIFILNRPSKTVSEVKSGKLTLYCEMHDGWRAIDKDKIITQDNQGYWIFTNGAARNCTTK